MTICGLPNAYFVQGPGTGKPIGTALADIPIMELPRPLEPLLGAMSLHQQDTFFR